MYRKYKNAKRTRIGIQEYTALRYVYLCPFCSTQHINYSLGKDIVRIKCSECGNEIIFDW